MKTTKRKIAASVRKATADGRAFVFASRDASVVESPESFQTAVTASKFSDFECGTCKTVMTASAGTEPFCVVCGSSHVHEVKADVTASVTSDANLSSLACKHCDHVSVLETATVRAITASNAQHIHCSACGNELQVDSDSLPTAEVEEFSDVQATPSTAAAVTADILDDTPVIDEVIEDEFGDDMSSMGDMEELPMETMDEPLEFIPDPIMSEASEELTVLDDAAIPDVSTADALMDGGLPDSSNPLVPEFTDGDPLMDALSLDDSDAALEFVTQANRLVAMKGHYAIAFLTKKAAGARSDLLGNKNFHASVKLAVRASGLRQGLKSAGFQSINVPVLTKASVSREIQAIQAKSQQAQSNYVKDFTSCLALASAGLSRGNFKNHTNPLRAAFEETLQASGVRGAKSVAARIFNDHGVEYAQTLTTLSSQLQKMSASSRRELASLLDMTAESEEIMPNAAPPFGSEEREEEFGEESSLASLETRFQTAALLRPPVNVSASSNNSEHRQQIAANAASQVLSGKAPLTFGF